MTDDDVTAEDAGTITCTVTISGVDYTSESFTLRISGEQLVYCVIACILYYIQCMPMVPLSSNKFNATYMRVTCMHHTCHITRKCIAMQGHACMTLMSVYM